jgi:large subunit ribosomal protein L16
MSTPLKRPFKVWCKGADFHPNFMRYTDLITDPELPVFTSYFFLAMFRRMRTTRRVIVRATEYAYLSRETIEAFRKTISPHFRKRSAGTAKFHIRCYPYLPLMKKPAEVRMGGGKGAKLRTFVCPVRPGQILFEICFRPAAWSRARFLYAARKLNVRVSISTV